MSGPGGMTATGYVASTQQEEEDYLASLIKPNVDAGVDTSPDGPFGQAISIIAEKFVGLHALGAEVYNAIDPANATGQLLANVSAVTGTYPQVATYSTVTANLTLNGSTTVKAGATAQVQGQPSNVWVLEADAVNTSTGQAVVDATFRSQEPGPATAYAGTLTVIGTPTPGWVAVTNPADAVEGLAADTDATLRTKRAEEVMGEGSGDLSAIRSAVLKVGGIIQCFVYENTDIYQDPVTGLPPKSFRVVIWDGQGQAAADNNVAQAIWGAKGAGIEAFGTHDGTATDADGVTHTVPFDRALQVPVYVSVNTNLALTAAQTSAIKAALASFALTDWTLGVSVVANELYASAYGVLGVGTPTKVTALYIGTAPNPVGTADITISNLQIATLASTNVLVNGQ